MNREEIHNCWRDEANWAWGVLYRCRQDPRVIVPRRWRWGGWTLNFGHPKAALAGIAAVALAVGPGLLTFLLTGAQGATLIVLFFSVVALVTWAHLESSRGK